MVIIPKHLDESKQTANVYIEESTVDLPKVEKKQTTTSPKGAAMLVPPSPIPA